MHFARFFVLLHPDMKKIICFLIAVMVVAACGNKSRRDEIEARKAALVNKQDSTLKATQQELAVVDSLLQIAKAEHDKQHAWVMAHATQLNDQSAEVKKLNELRSRRDSLQTAWQTLGAKIRYIQKMRNERSTSGRLLPKGRKK